MADRDRESDENANKSDEKRDFRKRKFRSKHQFGKGKRRRRRGGKCSASAVVDRPNLEVEREPDSETSVVDNVNTQDMHVGASDDGKLSDIFGQLVADAPGNASVVHVACKAWSYRSRRKNERVLPRSYPLLARTNPAQRTQACRPLFIPLERQGQRMKVMQTPHL